MSNIKNVNFSDPDKLRRNLPYLVEYMSLLTEIKKANYDVCVKEGFTEKQALELCKDSL